MVNLIPTKFGMKIQLATAKIAGGLIWYFFTIKLGHGRKRKFWLPTYRPTRFMPFSTLQFVPIAIIASMSIHLHSISYQ